MRARLALVVLTLAVTAPAFAQSSFEDLRPEDMRFPDNLGMEELPIGPVPEELLHPGGNAALSISDQVFGPQVDEAYGAFQRGYYLTALSLALPRAEHGDAAAQTLIAEIYAKGLGIAEDAAKAAGWYTLASNNGDALASFELAMMYQSGSGVEKDRKRAAELFAQAADRGSMSAKYNLGLLHIEGVFAEPNLVRAAALIKQAADAGIPEALYDYGGMLMEGAGVAPDPAAAVTQIALAAKEGLIAAQIEYATLLYLGKGVARDRTEAAHWYQRAAEAGNAVAQNRFAKLLAAGEGIGLDLETAAMWRALARRQGMNDPVLDKLLVSVRPEELARAEERARFWPSQPPTAVASSDAAPVLPAETATP